MYRNNLKYNDIIYTRKDIEASRGEEAQSVTVKPVKPLVVGSIPTPGKILI